MMMKFKLLLPTAALAAGILLPGCACFSDAPVTPQLQPISADRKDGDALALAKQNVADFAAAFQHKDIEKFKKVISEERRKQLTPEKFKKILEISEKEQGKLISINLIGVLDQVIYQTYLWKMTYEKKDSEGKMVKRDFLYFVSIGKTGENEYTVGAAGFRF